MLKDLFSVGIYRRNWALTTFMIVSTVIVSALEVLSLSTLVPIMNSIIGLPGGMGKSRIISSLTDLLANFRGIDTLTLLFGFFLVSNVVRILVGWWRDQAKVRLSFRIRMDAQNEFFKKYIRADIAHFTRTRHGELLYNILSLPSEVSSLYLIPPKAIVDMLNVLIIGLFLFDLSWKACLLVAVFGGIMGVGASLLTRRALRNVGKGIIASHAKQTSLAHELMGGNREIKAYSLHRKLTQSFEDFGDVYLNGKIKSSFMGSLASRFTEFAFFAGIGVIGLYFSLYDAEYLKSALPMATVYVFAVFRVLPSFYLLLEAYGAYQNYYPALEKYLKALGENTQLYPDGLVPVRGISHEIRFENVSFGYDSSKQVLDGLDLVIPANKTVAIVGSSGAGKSTLVDLLLGFYRPTQGRVIVDGVNLTDLTADSWLGQIGYVPQAPFIFNDSVKNNIVLDSPDDPVRFEQVLCSSHVDDFVNQMENKADAALGDRGLNLSGGQKQRVCIARALYRDPALLIFDEATSSLDSIIEGRITKTIREQAGKRTMVVLAHRLGTIREADIIYVLDKGRVTESGSFDELMVKKGAFTRLYEASV